MLKKFFIPSGGLGIEDNTKFFNGIGGQVVPYFKDLVKRKILAQTASPYDVSTKTSQLKNFYLKLSK